jgi:acetyl-CoA acetyltransferase family protein
MPEAVIVSALRAPIGRAVKGTLKDVRPDDLAALVIRAALEKVPQLDPNIIEDVIVGCAFPEGEQGMNVARLITGLAGLPVSVAATTVNRFCASSLTAVNMAAQSIMLGQGDAVIAAGVESMSRVPMGGFNPSYNPKLYENPVGIEICGGHGEKTTAFEQAYIPMGMTAENLAKQYNISREEQDRYALRSHMNAIKATDDGTFAREIVPVPLPNGDTMYVDDGPRRDTSLERLATLEPAFIKGGSVTAGNSSPLNDGAAAVVQMSREKAQELGIKPLARVITMSVSGVAPEVMGIGPVPAVRKALARAGMQLSDIDLVELNEAFAVQNLAVIRELGLNEDIVNIHGGGIALGHPLGCSGARITATLLNDLQSENKTIGLATLCVGGGQGVATIIERLA